MNVFKISFTKFLILLVLFSFLHAPIYSQEFNDYYSYKYTQVNQMKLWVTNSTLGSLPKSGEWWSGSAFGLGGSKAYSPISYSLF